MPVVVKPVALVESGQPDRYILLHEIVEPVKREEIPAGYKAHNTHLFMVEKFTEDGKHDKY